MKVLDENNVLAQTFKMARYEIQFNSQKKFMMKLIGKRTMDKRTYYLPNVSKVAALTIGDLDPLMDNDHDILVETKTG